MKQFETPQGSVKIKNLIFILIKLSEMHGAAPSLPRNSKA